MSIGTSPPDMLGDIENNVSRAEAKAFLPPYNSIRPLISWGAKKEYCHELPSTQSHSPYEE